MEDRNIENILRYRGDISPFLVHLTRDKGRNSAKVALKKILRSKLLNCGGNLISDAKYGWDNINYITSQREKELFSAICFTETPINEIHSLLAIFGRKIELKPYGLVFIKDKLRKKGVSPVLYINNERDDKDKLFQALCSMEDKYPKEAEKMLPLIAVFGNKITSPNALYKQEGTVDFLWEREWRLPFHKAPLKFKLRDIFVGICPAKYIDEFEDLFEGLLFIDPRRNMKLNLDKIEQSKERTGIDSLII